MFQENILKSGLRNSRFPELRRFQTFRDGVGGMQRVDKEEPQVRRAGPALQLSACRASGDYS
jgi:hypothetical protein